MLRPGPGEHRLAHVLWHGVPDSGKKVHTVFSGNVLQTVDDAWVMRGLPVAGDPGKYVIPMGRVVGTAGETNVTIVVYPGTNTIRTAYPSP